MSYGADLLGFPSLREAIVRHTMSMTHMLGTTVLIEHEGALVFAAGYGVADRQSRAATRRSTVYPIGSVTKQFTAAAIMQLVESHTIRLDDPIVTYLHEYPRPRTEVTVRQLLNHTSGIPDYTALPTFQSQAH